MTIIKEGFCIHFILGCGDFEWDYEFSEALIVHAEGPELLCKNPRILYMSENEYDFSLESNTETYLPYIQKYHPYAKEGLKK